MQLFHPHLRKFHGSEMAVDEGEGADFAVGELGAYLPHEVEWETGERCGEVADDILVFSLCLVDEVLVW